MEILPRVRASIAGGTRAAVGGRARNMGVWEKGRRRREKKRERKKEKVDTLRQLVGELDLNYKRRISRRISTKLQRRQRFNAREILGD